jgi:hypothetical protein
VPILPVLRAEYFRYDGLDLNILTIVVSLVKVCECSHEVSPISQLGRLAASVSSYRYIVLHVVHAYHQFGIVGTWVFEFRRITEEPAAAPHPPKHVGRGSGAVKCFRMGSFGELRLSDIFLLADCCRGVV